MERRIVDSYTPDQITMLGEFRVSETLFLKFPQSPEIHNDLVSSFDKCVDAGLIREVCHIRDEETAKIGVIISPYPYR